MLIPLNNNLFTRVDDEISKAITARTWFVVVKNGKRYVAATDFINGRRTRVYMHRLVTGCTDPVMHVDHIDGDGLNNCGSNLRICSNAQNNANRPKQANNTSGFKGVYYHKQRGKWCASITAMGKRRALGLHDTPEAAALAYNLAAIQYHGSFAKLNMIAAAGDANDE